MNKISLQELNDLVEVCGMNLTEIDYCNEKENIKDSWCDESLKTIEEVLDNYGIETGYINPKYNENRPDIDSITLIMDSGNGIHSDYFITEVLIKEGLENEGEIVASYCICDY